MSKVHTLACDLAIACILSSLLLLTQTTIAAETNSMQFSTWFALLDPTSRNWISNGTLVPSTPTGLWSSPKCWVMIMDANYNYGSTAGPLAVFCPLIVKNDGSYPINITLSTTQRNVGYTTVNIQLLPAGSYNTPNFNNQPAIGTSLVQPGQTALLFFSIVLWSQNNPGTPNPYRGQTFDYSFTLILTANSPNATSTYEQNIFISGTGQYVGSTPTPTATATVLPPTLAPTASPALNNPTSNPTPPDSTPTPTPFSTLEPTATPGQQQSNPTNSPSLPASPPSVPEFSWLTILLLLMCLFSIVFLIRHRRTPTG